MPPKTKCFTKPRKDGSMYTTCLGFQSGDRVKFKKKKAATPPPKKKRNIKFGVDTGDPNFDQVTFKVGGEGPYFIDR